MTRAARRNKGSKMGRKGRIGGKKEGGTFCNVRRRPGEPRLLLELTLNGKTTREADIYDNR